MNIISEVSETALLTLRARVSESLMENPILNDPVGKICLDRIKNVLDPELVDRIFSLKLSPVLTRHLALRARKYDSLSSEFLKEHPDGLIISLGCGLDTRFWRLPEKDFKYIELDLAPVIEAKSDVLTDLITYELIKGSVLDDEWLEKVKSIQSEKVLFLAEGLFMYLPREEAIKTFRKIAEVFTLSRLVVEVVNEKYTRGKWKKMVERKMKRSGGTTAGSQFNYGIKNPAVFESYSDKIMVREAWSYLEEKEVKPGFLRWFRNMRLMTNTQYTVVADIG